ncbi:HlyD family type I secretion periplasmic adaptor subunit [Rhizobium sp. TH2]|uniref:HlyD family type I secretion periplasmic adaptor subunit n=1 Tax=Rhizobium sp. TH2 TaxID=2775403 RepID=UPI0021580F16|nr:HlyD family type I secretion periplasmic adaptor subunit [Rhizobium sp. TH2]UVC10239.1 HlyD family type I secretion periplasmic adaptor subunit [Rhizobium sp. TH2]
MTAETKPKDAWSMRRYVISGFLTVFVLVFGFGAWSVFTNIAGAVVGIGVVEVETKRQIVQHATGGVVGKILVKEGQQVKGGETLLVFDDAFDRAELKVIESQLFPLLGSRGRLLAEQDDSPEPKFDPELVARAKTSATEADIVRSQSELLKARRLTRDQQMNQLKERQQQTNRQIDGLNSRIEGLNNQIALIDGDLKGQRELLRRGLTQRARVTALERDRAQAVGNIEEADASIAESKARIAEVELAIINVGSQMREEAIKELGDAEGRIAELRERRNSTLETLARIEVKAPMSGRVFNMTIHAIRQVVRAAEPILEIVPNDVKLVISVQVPPSQIDQIHVGQKAVIRFNAFDRRHTPDLRGTVRRVSADVITDERTGQSHYTVSLTIDPGEEKFLGNTAEIIPGMPVDAFIQTTERTPFDYLVRPITSYFGKSMLER